MSSTVSEDTSIKTQLKSLLNIQNSIHSLVSKNLVTEQGAEIFSRMTSLQSRWQALLVRLVRDTVGWGAVAGAVTEERDGGSAGMVEEYLSPPESSEDQDQAAFFTLDDLRNKEEEYSPPADEEDGHLYLT